MTSGKVCRINHPEHTLAALGVTPVSAGNSYYPYFSFSADQGQVLRTVYTPESDELFPSALAKLDIWVRQYHLHINRFPMWGERGQAEHEKLSNGSINDELGRRFRVELVQDEKRLNMPHLNRASQEDVRSLCDVFDDWVASVGQDPHAEYSLSPRFCDCLVVDEEALRSLAALPDETLKLYVAADSEEKRVSNLH